MCEIRHVVEKVKFPPLHYTLSKVKFSAFSALTATENLCYRAYSLESKCITSMKMHSTGPVHCPCIGGEAHSQTSNGLSLAAGRLVWPATATAAATLEFDALEVPHIGL